MAAGTGQGPTSEASQLENLKAVSRMVPGGHSWPFPTTIHQPHRLCLTLVQDRPGLKGRIASGSREASQGAAQTSGLSFHIIPVANPLCRGLWHVHPGDCPLSHSLGAALSPLLIHSGPRSAACCQAHVNVHGSLT